MCIIYTNIYTNIYTFKKSIETKMCKKGRDLMYTDKEI